MERILPGVWKITLGEPEEATPVKLRCNSADIAGLHKLPSIEDCPLGTGSIRSHAARRGFQIGLDLDGSEQLYGLGLQLLSFNQRGLKKVMRVNSDPTADLGDTHAPVPFFVSTRGYGVLVDTPRYATFYCGGTHRRHRAQGEVLVEIPCAAGADLYIFGGPGLREAVQRYVFFSGGGVLPPRWGLGVRYRCHARIEREEVESIYASLREDGIPCDVAGLEPSWQSHLKPCSCTWGESFADHEDFLQHMAGLDYRLDLWLHGFVHESSPIYEDILPYAGDFIVFGGIMPDFTIPEARRIYADHLGRELVDKGIAAFKLDECDNSDFKTQPWSFPEMSRFPSGLDGEQMHSLFGLAYQQAVWDVFRRRNLRTYGLVRSSHALAGPYPFVLYSDLYGFREFVRGLLNAGFSGLLWSPEVRHGESPSDLIRRLQTAAFSPMALINCFYLKIPPWKQWDKDKNNAGELLKDGGELERRCREILQLRMSFIPYLYSAFFTYWESGLPPFRALVMDYPEDENVWRLDDEYMAGDRLLVAPVFEGERREIYLPAGRWHDFWTGKPFEGERKYELEVPLDRIPLFVKGGALLPLARPTMHTDDPRSFELSVRVYGDGGLPATLIEDDGVTLDYERGSFDRFTLSHAGGIARGDREGLGDYPRYQVVEWVRMDPDDGAGR